MINVKIFRTSKGDISGYSVQGHSGTAEYGEDIVCAGVSTLAQTVILGIHKQLHRPMDFKVASGDLQMFLKDDPDELTNAILETMLLGLQEIAKIHPKAVSISESRR